MILRGLCHDDFVVLGQFFAKIVPLVVLRMHKMFLINCEVNIYLMKCFKKERSIITFFVFYVETASNIETFSLNFSSFNPFLSLPSVATNERKQNNIVLINKQETE
mgnify:CR=1 FL=1